MKLPECLKLVGWAKSLDPRKVVALIEVVDDGDWEPCGEGDALPLPPDRSETHEAD
jgi:hypothetical protein